MKIAVIVAVICALYWLFRVTDRALEDGDDMEEYTGNDKEGWKE